MMRRSFFGSPALGLAGASAPRPGICDVRHFGLRDNRSLSQTLAIETLREPEKVVDWMFIDIEKRGPDSPIGAVRDVLFSGIRVTPHNIQFRVARGFDYSARRKHVGGSGNANDGRRTVFAQRASSCTLANIRRPVVDNLSVQVKPQVLSPQPRSALAIVGGRDLLLRSITRNAVENAGPVVELENCREANLVNCAAHREPGRSCASKTLRSRKSRAPATTFAARAALSSLTSESSCTMNQNDRHQLQGRRRFLRAGVAAAAAAVSHDRILGANDRPKLALIGCGTRGSNALVPAAIELKNPFAAVCDVYKPNLDRALTALHARGGVEAASYGDYRKVIERADIDAVFIATPEHWHAQMAIDACKAGKDVYVEKPLAHTVEECMAIVEAAKKYKRIVQVGLQQRSMKIFHDALAMLRDGAIGQCNRCETAWGWGGSAAKPADPASAPPDGLDWEMWQGPAARHPYQASRQKGWHGYWDYGHGPITDVGVHVMDVARWFLDLGNPLSCFASALTGPENRPEQTPSNVDGVWRYNRGLVTYSSRSEDMTDRFWGEKGWLFVNREFIRTALFGRRGRAMDVKETRLVDPGYESVKIPNVVHTAVHVKNFLEAVSSRRQPSAPPEEAAVSTIACLLAARSMRTGKAYAWDGAKVKEL